MSASAPTPILTRLWSCRWAVVRVLIVSFVLWALVADTGSRLARLRYHALPDFDFAADAASLRAKGRFGEARVSAEAGLAFASDPATIAELQRERDLAQADQESWLRRARDVGLGALTGAGGSAGSGSGNNAPAADDEYATLERLAGSVIADFFIVGDVRDLVIQGFNAAAGRETDPIIAALSAIGLATTVAPQIDWGASVLKVARRTGALGKPLTDVLIGAVRTGDTAVVRAVASDAATLSAKASPSGALRLVRLADDPADLATMARLADRHGAVGVAAARFTGKSGLRFVRASSGGPHAARADELVVMAARKGEKGGAWLRAGGATALLRPHALVGLAKVFYKGDAPELAKRLAALADAHAWWLIPALAGYLTLECWGMGRKVLPGRPVIAT